MKASSLSPIVIGLSIGFLAYSLLDMLPESNEINDTPIDPTSLDTKDNGLSEESLSKEWVLCFNTDKTDGVIVAGESPRHRLTGQEALAYKAGQRDCVADITP